MDFGAELLWAAVTLRRQEEEHKQGGAARNKNEHRKGSNSNDIRKEAR